MKLDDLENVVKLELLTSSFPDWAQWVYIDEDGWLLVSDGKPTLKMLSPMSFYWDHHSDVFGHRTDVLITDDFFYWLEACEDFDEDGPYKPEQLNRMLWNISTLCSS